jgi:hypothetical protein
MDELLFFTAVGFAAQLVDGALGMAYGITATTMLLSVGVAPAVASASVHAAETVTTGLSGRAHWRFGNVDRDLFWRIALPGMIGGVCGAYLLATVPGEQILPFVSLYLLAMGLVILWKAIRPRIAYRREPRSLRLLGFAGGFLDAVGGGGWGPLVASTLVGNETAPRFAIGSLNAAHRPRALADHRRADPRWRVRGSVCRLRHPAAAGPSPNDPRCGRRDPAERLQPPAGPAVSVQHPGRSRSTWLGPKARANAKGICHVDSR